MKELSFDDEVIFKVGGVIYEYEVGKTILFCRYNFNDSIFTVLGISSDEKRKLAEKYYGYEPSEGSWPAFRENDYEAATQLVKHLYDLCNKYNLKHT